MIKLVKITEQNFRAVVKMELSEPQSHYVASNAVSLAQAWLYPKEARPFAIVNEEEQETAVGFLMLDWDEGERTVGIWRLMIDPKYQGRGFGKKAIEEVITMVKQEKKFDLIHLDYVPENQTAAKLYQKMGFRENGEVEDGEIVMVLPLTDQPKVGMLVADEEDQETQSIQYQDMNARTIDSWIQDGWEWGVPISHEVYEQAKYGKWGVYLTPTKIMPLEWFPQSLAGKKVLGLASGGGQQMPIFAALGASCTVLDYSEKQLESEQLVAQREQYEIEVIRYDMTKPLPFEAETFDIIFHPVSNVYVEKVEPIFAECYRILKKGGILVAGLDNGFNFVVNEEEKIIENSLPFNPLKNREQYELLMRENDGVQFSHTFEEQIGGQLKAGFQITDVYEDTNGYGRLEELHIPTFWATRAVK